MKLNLYLIEKSFVIFQYSSGSTLRNFSPKILVYLVFVEYIIEEKLLKILCNNYQFTYSALKCEKGQFRENIWSGFQIVKLGNTSLKQPGKLRN